MSHADEPIKDAAPRLARHIRHWWGSPRFDLEQSIRAFMGSGEAPEPDAEIPASPPHAAAEPEKPVAWMYEREGMNSFCEIERSASLGARGWTETPLYAAVQQPAREPTEDQMRAVCDNLDLSAALCEWYESEKQARRTRGGSCWANPTDKVVLAVIAALKSAEGEK